MDVTKSAIEVKNLSRLFNKDQWVLKDLNFSINVGEKVGIVGVNGSGKTTLLKILASLTLPTEGKALVMGKDTKSSPLFVRAHVGWVPASDSQFYPRLNGRENLHSFWGHKISKLEINQRIAQWQPHLPLKEALETPYYLCSSGMRQALNFCRALIFDPEILLLDEPTRSLDQESLDKMIQTINNEFSKKTLLVASHDHIFLEKVTTQQIQIESGSSC